MGLRIVTLTDPWVERALMLGARDLAGLPRAVRSLADHLLHGAPQPG